MASARLRKTFRYPDSDSDDNLRNELDEHEQETLIHNLRLQDEERNTQYKFVFTILPLVSSILYLPVSLASSSSAWQRFLCLMGVASLLCTAYIVWNSALSSPDRKGKRPMRDVERENRSLKAYLKPVNAFVCVALWIAAYFLGNSVDSIVVLQTLYVAPGAIYGIVYMVLKTMMSVDIGELEQLRYDLKGA